MAHNSGQYCSAQSSILNPRAYAGFTLIELVIVIGIIGVLASFFFERVLFYQESAEKAAMQQVSSAIQTALVLEYGHRMASGNALFMKGITNENPMGWLAVKPENYAGEIDGVTVNQQTFGKWVFDRGTSELIYIPLHATYLTPSRSGNKWIRFRTRFLYESSLSGARSGVMAGVVFSPVEPYQWLIKENE